MGRFGLHALVWGSDNSDEGVARAIGNTADVGYDLIEMVIFDPTSTPAGAIAKGLHAARLGVVTGMALNRDADISNPDPQIAARGEAFIADAILATRDMGSTLLGGVTHSAMVRYVEPPAKGTRERLIESYSRLAGKAKTAGVRLGIEAVNRYESHVVNTADDAAAIVRSVGSPNLFAHVDTFHMNIEEHDMAGAIERNIDVIGHFHIGESHRGYLGSGSVVYEPVFRALVSANYSGPVVFEAFSPAVLDSGAVNALASWTTHWSDSRDLAEKGLAFMRAQWASAEAAIVNKGPLTRPEL
jgi:D-psicose/D-tagatose/L-ribulose 3-epimerase